MVQTDCALGRVRTAVVVVVQNVALNPGTCALRRRTSRGGAKWENLLMTNANQISQNN
jgi:hypothetical protein